MRAARRERGAEDRPQVRMGHGRRARIDTLRPGWVDGWMARWMDRWMGGWKVDEWMAAWMKGWMAD
eukprot:8964741-Pyramimonas_sp.AAC.1